MMKMNKTKHMMLGCWVAACAAWLVALSVGFAPEQAQACGGFFCSPTGPVNQAAERIIFSDNPDGTVTAVVQILYQGPSEQFAWVLPVPTPPTIEVSSNVALTRLQTATNPQYNLTTTVEGDCRQEDFFDATSGGGFADTSFGGQDSNSPPGVTVLDAGSVGPYDYELIQIDPAATDPAQVAVDWLTENGYDLMGTGPDVLRPYLIEGKLLLAFRLTKDADAGDIRPVILTYQDTNPMIPIRPTAVAANDNMGVMTWVLGDHRAVPTNYRALVLNEAVIDWITGARNYADVINLAADEGGGQGFVTELAGPTAPLSDVIFATFEDQNWQSMRGRDWSANHTGLIIQTISTFSAFDPSTFSTVAWDGMPDAIRAHVPLPDGVAVSDVLSCVWCFFTEGQTLDGFDPAAYLDAIEADVVQPMRRTQEILRGRPYVTRLYTTLSAREMTIDPDFDFNPDLPDLSNIHQATRVIECNPDVFLNAAPWRTTLPSGLVVRGEGNLWPIQGGDDMPFNALVLRMSLTGEGEVVTDNNDAIRAAVAKQNEGFPSGGTSGGGTSGGTSGGDTAGGTSGGTSGGDAVGGGGDESDDCGCQTVRAPQQRAPQKAWWALALGAGAAVALRRRGGAQR